MKYKYEGMIPEGHTCNMCAKTEEEGAKFSMFRTSKALRPFARCNKCRYEVKLEKLGIIRQSYKPNIRANIAKYFKENY